jgi:hypothetical protein
MLTQEQIEYIRNNYGKKNAKEIATELNIKPFHIGITARKLGISYGRGKNPVQTKHCRTRRINVDDDFFDEPNLLNCYWAGFLAADGNIRQVGYRKELGLQLSQKDINHMRKFAEQIKFTGTVTSYMRSNGISMCSVHINSNKICEDLEKNFNITPKKTFTLQPPSNLTDDQKDCYIAGYIDGDGCIQKIKTKYNKYIVIDARGTEEIVNYIKQRFLEISKDDVFGNRFKCGNINTEDATKNHKRYTVCGKICNIIINKYKKYDIPLLERKWSKEV